MKNTSKKIKKICLIDADSLLYESASVNQVVFAFSDEDKVIEVDEEGAKEHLDSSIEKIVKATGCTDYLMYITGPTNFRYDVLPTYKHNRKNVERPVLLDMLKEHVLSKHPCKMTSKVEADDACTITYSKNPSKYVLAHIDKDLNQVEGTHYNWRDDLLYEVTKEEALRMFFRQVLIGDSTDGYSGCPLVGVEKAEVILNKYMGVIPVEHVFKSGPRKGQVEIRWQDKPMDDLWDAIVSQYLKAHFRKGTLTDPKDYKGAEELALQQARVARMLRADEFINGEVILWSYKPLDIDLRRDTEYDSN